jgi:hypothetical protein
MSQINKINSTHVRTSVVRNPILNATILFYLHSVDDQSELLVERHPQVLLLLNHLRGIPDLEDVVHLSLSSVRSLGSCTSEGVLDGTEAHRASVVPAVHV